MNGSVCTTRRRPRAWSFALLVLGIWTVAVSPIAGAQHRATHVHVTCEHGEEIEVGPATTAAAPVAARSIDARDDGHADGEAVHDHCSLGCAAPTAVAARPIVTVANLETPGPAARAPLRVVPAIDVLVDAPKTSPPA